MACTALIKLGPTGRKLWTRRHFQFWGSIPHDIVYSQGAVHVAAQEWLPGGLLAAGVLKYSRSGQELWGKWWSHAGFNDTWITQLAASAAGVLVTGYDQGGDYPGFFARFTHDALSEYSGVVAYEDATTLRDCAIDAAGNCYVAGPVRMVAAGPLEFVVKRYDAVGFGEAVVVRWAGQVGTNAGVSAIALATDGQVYATGYRTRVPGGPVMWTATGPDPDSWGTSWAGDLGTHAEGMDIAVRGAGVYVVGRCDDGRMVLARYAR
jgi:hypothetical protein